MVITCEKCSTRFNLDESLLRKEGSKVRCCRCRHVFTAFPSTTPVLLDDMPRQEKSSKESPDKIQEKIDPDFFMEPGPGAFSLDNELDNELDLGFSFDPDDLTLDDDLELDQNHLLDIGPETSESSQGIKTDGYSHGTGLEFDDDMDFENQLELELEEYGELDLSTPDLTSLDSDSDMDFHLDMNLDQDLDSDLNLDLDTAEPGMDLLVNGIQEEAGHGIEPGDDDTQDDLNLEFELEMEPDGLDKFPSDPGTEELEQDEEINLAEFHEVLEAGDSDLKVENPEEFPLDDSLESPAPDEIDDHEFSNRDRGMQSADPDKGEKPQLLPVLEEEDETTIAPPHLDYGINEPFKRPIKARKSITIILLLAILTLVAYSACIFYGVKIPYISTVKVPYLSNFLAPEPPAPEPVNLAPDKQSVNGRFVTNTTAGTLFVITGKVTNTSNVTLSKIKVKGTLITRDKVKAKTKIVPCGNLIPEDQLKNGEMSQINLLLAGETGNNSSNDNIQPGQSIPFMIVFSDLPENLENFTVNTEEFERKAREN
ncbi:MAG: DUF3426 domain-containing protein [Desulfobacterium sp.]|jgi:predicted Zn finger-like uncharacterized protein|nr:DUF3426 domain-containing protein [Desulfobacterium sp.]